MTGRQLVGAVLFFMGSYGAPGDTLVLKNGQTIEGRYLGSTEDSVRFEVGGQALSVFDVADPRTAVPAGGESLSTQEAPYTGARGKEQQEHFCRVLQQFIRARNQVSAEPNLIRRAQMPSSDAWSFEDCIARVFGPHVEFADWTGHLFLSVTGTDVLLTFEPTCGTGLSVSFINGYPADARNAARLPLSSTLAQKLRDASLGGLYRVPGRLFVRSGGTSSLASARGQTDQRQHFESAHLTGIANVANPQYLVQFTDLVLPLN